MTALGGDARGWPALLAPRPPLSTGESAAGALLCIAAITGVFVGDYATGGSGTVGALAALPVLVAAWFLAQPWTLAITTVALAFRVLALVLGDVTPVTFASQSLVLVVVALAGGVAATSLTRAAIARAALADVEELRRAEAAVAAALDEAEVTSNAKSEYLSRVSHELRTPLTVILGFVGLLEIGDRHAPRRRAAGAVAILAKPIEVRELLDAIDEALVAR